MITIGLLDDHQMFLDGMVSVLSNQVGFSILFVENNARSALEKIKINPIDYKIKGETLERVVLNEWRLDREDKIQE